MRASTLLSATNGARAEDYAEASTWYAEAMKWYRKAAEQGNAGAQYELGNMYKSG